MPGAKKKELTGPARWTPIFLARIAAGDSVTKAAETAEIGYHAVNHYKRHHPEFAEAWDAAQRQATDRLRDVIWKRAVEGVEVPVFSAQLGRQIGTETKYDTQLLMFEAKRRDPAYRENFKVEHTGTVGHAIELKQQALEGVLGGREPVEISPEQRRQAARALLEGAAPDPDVIEGTAVDLD